MVLLLHVGIVELFGIYLAEIYQYYERTKFLPLSKRLIRDNAVLLYLYILWFFKSIFSSIVGVIVSMLTLNVAIVGLNPC